MTPKQYASLPDGHAQLIEAWYPVPARRVHKVNAQCYVITHDDRQPNVPWVTIYFHADSGNWYLIATRGGPVEPATYEWTGTRWGDRIED